MTSLQTTNVGAVGPEQMRRPRFRLPEEAGILLILLVVLIVMSVMSPNFRTLTNMQTLLLNGAVITFLALGQTFVLLTGGIDLSTGSNVAMTGVLASLLMFKGMPWWGASLVALAAGVVLGVLNGVLIHYVGLPAFIVTFSTFGIAGSIPFIITSANSISVKDPMFAVIGRGGIAGIPMPVVMVLIAAVLFTFLLRRTALGVRIYATGGNAEASRLAGVNIARTTIFVYAVSGLCGAFGGLITTSRLMVGYPSAGSGNELFFSIAASVVGGVSLFGGIGTIPGAFLGAVLIATVSNGMNVLGVQSYWQPAVIGVIILGGVILDAYRRKLSAGDVLRRLKRQTSLAPPPDHPTAPTSEPGESVSEDTSTS